MRNYLDLVLASTFASHGLNPIARFATWNLYNAGSYSTVKPNFFLFTLSWPTLMTGKDNQLFGRKIRHQFSMLWKSAFNKNWIPWCCNAFFQDWHYFFIRCLSEPQCIIQSVRSTEVQFLERSFNFSTIRNSILSCILIALK